MMGHECMEIKCVCCVVVRDGPPCMSLGVSNFLCQSGVPYGLWDMPLHMPPWIRHLSSSILFMKVINGPLKNSYFFL